MFQAAQMPADRPAATKGAVRAQKAGQFSGKPAFSTAHSSGISVPRNAYTKVFMLRIIQSLIRIPPFSDLEYGFHQYADQGGADGGQAPQDSCEFAVDDGVLDVVAGDAVLQALEPLADLFVVGLIAGP